MGTEITIAMAEAIKKMDYAALKLFLKELNFKSTSEYKDFARAKNAELGSTVFPVSPDLKFKKVGTWVGFPDFISLEENKLREPNLKEETIVVETIVEAETEVVVSVVPTLGTENFTEVVVAPQIETVSSGDDTTWDYDELKEYVSTMHFSKLTDYKNFARTENKNKMLHLNKKLPVSPDIYFKSKGIEWAGANDFLSLNSTPKLTSSKPSKLESGVKQMEAVLNDEVVVNAPAPVKVADYEVADVDTDLLADKKSSALSNAIIRLSNIAFRELDYKANFANLSKSGTYGDVTTVLVAQTEKRSITNIVFYDKISKDSRHSPYNLLISKTGGELKVLFFNNTDATVEITEKEMVNVCAKVLSSKSILDKQGNSYNIFETMKALEKSKKVIHLFLANSNYVCFFDKDLDLDAK